MAAKGFLLTKCSNCKSTPSFSFGSKPAERDCSEAAPGPGKYGFPSVKEKYTTSPAFNFGRGGEMHRNKKLKTSELPGPGQYMARDPNGAATGAIFGSEARIPTKKVRQGPEPGAYRFKSSLKDRDLTIGTSAARFKEKTAEKSPEPGQYGVPSLAPVSQAQPTAYLRTTENRSKTDFTKNTVCSPGPVYPIMKELGGNICTRTSPAFTMSSRRKPMKSDSSSVPGPQVAHFTQFDAHGG